MNPGVSSVARFQEDENDENNICGIITATDSDYCER
jgi:hypothetical protein